jgi:hypothetical protein
MPWRPMSGATGIAALQAAMPVARQSGYSAIS